MNRGYITVMRNWYYPAQDGQEFGFAVDIFLHCDSFDHYRHLVWHPCGHFNFEPYCHQHPDLKEPK